MYIDRSRPSGGKCEGGECILKSMIAIDIFQSVRFFLIHNSWFSISSSLISACYKVSNVTTLVPFIPASLEVPM